MGGRGSYFQKIDSTNVAGYKPYRDFIYQQESLHAKEDKDTTKENDGRTKILLNKNIHIKQSTDNLVKEIFMPNLDKINKLTDKYLHTTRILKENDKELAIRADNLPSGVVASFISNSMDLDKMRIVLNKNLEIATREAVEASTQREIDDNNWVKCDKEELVNQTITHEFGHYVQRVLMDRDLQTKTGKAKYNKLVENLKNESDKTKRENLQTAYYEFYAKKYLTSIDNIQAKNFNKRFTLKDTSDYGKKNLCETFAETFAELNNNKEPSTLAKSMEIFLKKQLNRKPLTKTNKNNKITKKE